MRDQDQESFNDAMNQWMSRQSVLTRISYTLFHLPHSSGIFGKLFGILWRLALPAAVAWIVYCFIVSSHLEGTDFLESLESDSAALMNAEEVTMTGLKWSGGLVKVKEFEAEGRPGSFFSSLRATNLSIERDHYFIWPVGLMSDEPWYLGDVKARVLDITLKSGYDRVDQTSSSARKERTTISAGYGIEPQLTGSTFKRIISTNATLRWGFSDSTRGEVKNTSLAVERKGPDAWKLKLRGGTISQNWINDVAIEELEISIEDETIIFEKAKLKLGEVDLPLVGEVRLGRLPELDLSAEVKAFNPKDLIPSEFSQCFSGLISGSLKIEGSINSSDGVTTSADIKVLNESLLRTPIVFKDFSGAFQQTGVHPFYIKSGDATFSTRGGNFNVDDMHLTSIATAILTGSFEIVGDEFDGSLNLGLTVDTVESNPRIAAKYFGPAENGMRWHRDVVLSGPFESLTDEFSDQVSTDVIAAENER